jgi:uncharacterized membrane protein
MGSASSSAADALSFKMQRTRFIEIDVLRGVSLFLMIFLHLWWDLEYFGVLKVNRSIYQIQHVVASMFFILMGMCLVITYYKYAQRVFFRHTVFRGLYIFSLGMMLSAVTFILIPERPIYFGVLHCIGLCIILCLPFLRLRWFSIVFAILFICTGFVFGAYPMENASIMHIAVGLHPSGMYRYTIDYFPLIPWLGVALLGVAFGSVLYRDGKRQFSFPEIPHYKSMFLFSWLGKHSLLVYLLHQPLIAGFIKGFLYLSRIL